MSPLSLRQLVEIGEKVVQKKHISYKDIPECGITVEEVAEEAWKYARSRIVEIVVNGERSSSFISSEDCICTIDQTNVKCFNIIMQNDVWYTKLFKIMDLHLRDEGLVCLFERSWEPNPRLCISITELC